MQPALLSSWCSGCWSYQKYLGSNWQQWFFFFSFFWKVKKRIANVSRVTKSQVFQVESIEGVTLEINGSHWCESKLQKPILWFSSKSVSCVLLWSTWWVPPFSSVGPECRISSILPMHAVHACPKAVRKQQEYILSAPGVFFSFSASPHLFKQKYALELGLLVWVFKLH